MRPIAKGESLTLSNDLFADLVPGTGSVSLSVGLSTALDAAALLAALDRYPFGCSEQITSRALPLLYVNELASEAHLALDTAIDQRIRDAIDRLLARQGSNGSFGLWSARRRRRLARLLRHRLPDAGARARLRGAGRRVQARARPAAQLRRNAEEPSKNGGRDLAYALYVLARNGAAPIGDLRYFADTKLDDFATADRQGAARRRARHARRPRARRARLSRRRCTRSRRSPRSNTAAPTTARRCATRRRS